MERPLEILKELSQFPAVAFHEALVSNGIKNILRNSRINFIEDDFGNLIVELKGSNTEIPPIAFVAHMDHPGFEVQTISDNQVIASPLGGVPYSSISNGADCFVLDNNGQRISCTLVPIPDSSDRIVEVIDIDSLKPKTPIFFNLEDFSIEGDFIYMRALDDLAGCAAIIAALENIMNNSLENTVYAVFTRAEEVGLIGARLLAKSNILRLDSFVVSVETSSVVPGVVHNIGPVIRTGDASYTFDSQAEQILMMSSNNIKNKYPNFKFQRHLMDAGSCEASAFMAYGYRSTGIAFPLGNWHNATTRIKDIDSGISSEYIGVDDFLNGVILIQMAMEYGSTWEPDYISNRYKEVDDMLIKRLKED